MTEARESLDHCVKCTICETACPYSKATPLFPGPKYVGPQAERYRAGGPSPDASVDYCSGCGICTQVCPHGVLIAEINSKARARLWEDRGIPLRNKLIARPSVTGRLGTPAASLANRTLESPLARTLVDRTLGIDARAPLPRFAGSTFSSWARRHRPPATERSIVYFHGCSTNYYEPKVGQMVVAVLEHNGFRVVVPRQDCCGLPLQSNGDFPAARSYVRRLAANLAPHARAGLDIVTNSTSCGLMLKREARRSSTSPTTTCALSASTRGTSASSCSICTTAGSSGPISPRSVRPSRTTLPASSAGTASASPRSTCFASCRGYA